MGKGEGDNTTNQACRAGISGAIATSRCITQKFSACRPDWAYNLTFLEVRNAVKDDVCVDGRASAGSTHALNRRRTVPNEVRATKNDPSVARQDDRSHAVRLEHGN